jgi:hypothetical protein
MKAMFDFVKNGSTLIINLVQQMLKPRDENGKLLVFSKSERKQVDNNFF